MAAKKPKMDPAHEETERIIKEMENRITKEYAQAEKEVQVKINDYFERFRLKDEKWREWVADGKKTAKEYQQWRIGQLAVGKRWESLKQTVAEDYAHTDQIARSIVKGYMPEVYATNFNYGTYEVEVGAKVDTSFTLYDRQTVERIMRDNPDLLPAPGKKVSKAIAEGKAVRWNKQLIQSVMTQGILQGESIPKLATRLAKEVGDSDRKAAIRNARTMATGAQNAGRVDSYKRAEGMGINMEQEWRATLDMRTRHEHRQLDGQRQKVGDPFTVDGYKIMFPGDPSAEGFLIYNCRCTLRGVVAGLDPQARKYRDESAIDGLTYDEWKAQKKSESNPITLPEEKGEAIAEKFRREYRDGVFSVNNKQEKQTTNPTNRFGEEIQFSDAMMEEKWKKSREMILTLADEFETKLKEVKTGNAQLHGGGATQISGTIMELRDSHNIYTTIHEFAHSISIENQTKFGLYDETDFWKEIKKIQREYKKEVQKDYTKMISAYEYGQKGSDEFFAEAFAQIVMTEKGLDLPQKYGKDTTYSRKVLEVVHKYFGKEK